MNPLNIKTQAAPSPLRTVRSYVLRQGRMTRAQTLALEQHWAEFGLALQDAPIHLATVFGRTANTTLEIGFGNGATLLQMASEQPETHFLGIEVHLPGVGALLHGIASLGLKNIRVFQHDAVQVLTQCIPAQSLNKIQIFFPDPWPKKRHHKRRLIQPDFLHLLHQRLKTGGILHLATDWQPYAEHMLTTLSAQSGWNNLAGQPEYDQCVNTRPKTKFEARGQRLGHGVFDLVFRAHVNQQS